MKYKFKYNNRTMYYKGLSFVDGICETDNDFLAQRLREDSLFGTFITEIKSKEPVELTEEEQARFDELVEKGKHTTPEEKSELKKLKDKKEGK